MSAADRLRLIRLVHTAARELHMDRDTYRDVLRTVTGKDSCSSMSAAELQVALDHLKKCGFKVRPTRRPSRPLDFHAESRKIRALWLLLHELDVVRDASEAALGAYVKRMTGVEALQWINSGQTERVIESLKKWAMRYLPQRVKRHLPAALGSSLSDSDRISLQDAIAKAWERQTFDPMLEAWGQVKRAITHAGQVPGNGQS